MKCESYLETHPFLTVLLLCHEELQNEKGYKISSTNEHVPIVVLLEDVVCPPASKNILHVCICMYTSII